MNINSRPLGGYLRTNFPAPSAAPRITFDPPTPTVADLVAQLPGFASLAVSAKRCRTWRSWEAIKRQLGAIVGWHARGADPQFRSQQAWQTGHDYLLGIAESRRPLR